MPSSVIPGTIQTPSPPFTDDGVWDGGETWGRYEGHSSLWTFFDRASSMLPFAMHYMINPVIEISGNEATGQWHLFQATTYAATNDAVWGAGRYFEEYVRDEAGWKFGSIRLESMFWTPFAAGWVRTPFVQGSRLSVGKIATNKFPPQRRHWCR
jgi:hypothetical protein